MIIRLIITINLKSICILTGVSLIFSLPYRQVSNSVLRPRSAHQLVPLWSPGSILQGCLLLLWRVKLQLIPGTHIKSSHKPSIMAGASCSKLSDVRPSPWSWESFKRNTALSGLNSTMQRRKTKQIMGRIHAKVHISPLFSILTAGKSFPARHTHSWSSWNPFQNHSSDPPNKSTVTTELFHG